jgi:hypothetical protein
MPAGQDNSSMFLDIDPVFPEILCRNSFNMDKRPEVDLQGVLFSQIVVRRFVGFRFRLGDEDRL